MGKFRVLANGVKMPAVGFGTYKAGSNEETAQIVKYAIEIFDELMDVLGLLYNRNSASSLDDEIEALIAARNEARKNKNWAEADRIRDELKAQGIVLEDTPQGVKWHRA